MPIKILNNSTINKIAAGEVIDRPASVVKEILENSLDAGGDDIKIEIENGGIAKIKISDNGMGMSKEDLLLCAERHATSKIESDKDLFNIYSFGFRGEALASIAEIAILKITTKRDCDALGTSILIEAGTVKKIESVACSKGTTVEINDLFFSVPVRREYLKSREIEFSHILKIVSKYALIKNNVSILLIHDGREIINSQKTNSFLNNIIFVLGVEVGKDLIGVNYQELGIEVTGYISKPNLTRADKTEQSLYVNSRYVKDKSISDTIYSAYKTLLFINRNPIFVLNVEINPSQIDVNVHPNKEFIKFQNNKQVKEIVYKAIKESLKETDLIPEANLEEQNELKPTHVYEFTTDKQVNLFLEEESNTQIPLEKITTSNKIPIDVAYQIPTSTKQNDIQPTVGDEHILKINEVINRQTSKSKFGKFNILGQVNKTFVICEGEDGLVMFDQHAAEERVNYERFMKEFYGGAIKKQRLLESKIVELNPEQKQIAMNNIGFLESMGFEFDDFGGNSLKLSTVPEIFGKLRSILFIDILNELLKNKNQIINKEIEEKIIKTSCRASVKAGTEMTKDEIKNLLNKLERCENPYSCPHGRPTIIKLTISELEKKFKRTGW